MALYDGRRELPPKLLRHPAPETPQTPRSLRPLRAPSPQVPPGLLVPGSPSPQGPPASEIPQTQGPQIPWGPEDPQAPRPPAPESLPVPNVPQPSRPHHWSGAAETLWIPKSGGFCHWVRIRGGVWYHYFLIGICASLHDQMNLAKPELSDSFFVCLFQYIKETCI